MENNKKEPIKTENPTGFSVIVREFKKDTFYNSCFYSFCFYKP